MGNVSSKRGGSQMGRAAMVLSARLAGPGSRRAALLSGAAALLTVTAGAPALAQQTSAQGAPTQIGEVVVTAQRRSENIQNVPVSVQAISSKEIEQAGIKQSTDIAKLTPNVTITLPTGEGNNPDITIRGIGLNDYNTNNSGPNGIYVDDVYISAPSAQAFGIFDVDQIQVLKGPQGTLYGRNTSGGAILLTSRKPTDDLRVDAHAEYSSFNTYQVQAGVGGQIIDGLDGRIAFVVNHSDGFMKNLLTGNPASGTDNQSVRLQLQYKPTDKLKIALSSTFGHVDNNPEQYRHYGVFVPGTQGDPAPTLCSISQIYAGACVDMDGFGTPKGYWDGAFERARNLKVRNSMTFLRTDYDAGPVTLTSITSFQHNDKLEPEDSDASPNRLVEVTYGVKSDTWTQEVRAAYASHDLNWVVGAYYLNEKLKQDQPAAIFLDNDRFGGFGIPPGPGNFDGIAQISQDHSKQTTESAAVFGQIDYTWRQLTATLGGRYTSERKAFDLFGSTQFQSGGEGNFGPPTNIANFHRSLSASNFTWRAALSYHVSSDVLTYASVATGFKSGGFNGGFLGGSDPNVVAVELVPVAPEKVTAYEVGLKSAFFEHRLVVDAAAFYNEYNNQQVLVTVNRPLTINTPDGPSSVLSLATILANAQKGHSEGVEMQVTAVPIDGLTISLQPAWLRTAVDQGSFTSFDETSPGVFVPSPVSLKGKQYANAPHFSFHGSANYVLPLKGDNKLEFAVSTTYVGHQFFDTFNDPFIQQTGYWVHDANITYRSPKGWDLGLFARNLSNTKYAVTVFDLSGPFGLLTGTVGRPRTFGVELNYHY